MASDIDFDELDRAVNSLLGGKDNQAATDQASPDSEPAVQPSVALSDDTPVPSSVASVPPRPAQSLPPANRRGGGRFMDIRPGSRPAASDGSPAPVAATPSASRPVAAGDSLDHQDNTPNNWPDPIDFMSRPTANVDTPVAKPDDTPVDAPLDTPVDTPVTPTSHTSDESDTPDEPPTSPFLPDAKVEKRPLGSFVSASLTSGGGDLMDHHDEVKLDAPSAATPAADSSETVANNENEPQTSDVDNDAVGDPDSLTPPVVDSDTPMPAELQQDVLSLESDEVKASTEPTATSEAGPTSIMQQYKEKPSTETPPSGAIYDTESYHRPIVAKQAARGGALKIVLWVLGLIIVGAGAGAAVYFFVFPLLK